LTAPAYKANSAETSLTGFSMTVTDKEGIISDESILQDVTVTADSANALKVLIHGVDGAYAGAEVSFSVEVQQLGSRLIKSIRWFKDGADVTKISQGSWVMLEAPRNQPSFNVEVEVELDDGTTWKSEQKKITLMLDRIVLEAPPGFEGYVTSAAKHLNVPGGQYTDQSHAKFTASPFWPTKLTIECDDGYGWLVSIKPPVWGSRINTPWLGVNKFYGTKSGTGIYMGSHNGEVSYVVWGAEGKYSDNYETILGCWKM